MKKIKKVMALAVCALGLVSLAGCGITTKANYIIEYVYVNPNGTIETKYITADDIFERYLTQNPSNVAEAVYDAMYEIQIRLAFTEEGGAMNEYLNEINRETDIDLIEAQDAADEADTDWEDYLTDTLGYDNPNWDEDEKEAQYWIDQQYANMVEKVEDEYYDIFSHWQSNENYYTNNDLDYSLQQKYNLIWGDNGYINSRLPYHVKHILVQIGSTEDDYTRSEVTSEDVTILYNVVNALVDNDVDDRGTTFNSIAQIWSEDTGISTNPNGYVMDLSTSFVDEFKLGVYVYEALLQTDSSSAISNANTVSAYNDRVNSGESTFNIPGYSTNGNHEEGSIAEYFSDLGVGYIPYGAIAELYRYKDMETVGGQTVNDGEAAYYPRNIIFNKYFNRHNIAFITDEDVSYAESENDFDEDAGETGNTSIGKKIVYSDGTVGYSDIVNGSYATGDTYSGLNTANFRTIKVGDDEEKNVLCDENGNPIMVTLNATSSNGLHFIVVERSGLIDTALEHRHDNQTAREVTLEEYFAPENPLNSNGYTLDENGNRVLDYNTDFPGVDSDYDGVVDGEPKITFVYNDTIMSREDYEVLVSSGDSNLKDLYESYQESAGDSTASVKEFIISNWLEDASSTSITVTATNEDVQALIDKYVEQTQVSYDYGISETLYNAWISYYNTVYNQEREREKGLIPETCALNFGDSDYYSEGSMCYYSSSQEQSSSE